MDNHSVSFTNGQTGGSDMRFRIGLRHFVSLMLQVQANTLACLVNAQNLNDSST